MPAKTTDQPELTVRELAERLKTDPRDLRKWLRSQDMGVGRGGKRYAFTAKQATELGRKYKADLKKAAESEHQSKKAEDQS